MIKLLKRLLRKNKEVYPYYCTQPRLALTNRCNYGPDCNRKCLMPYKGCNHQIEHNDWKEIK